jgi:hypothetical protein
LANVERANMSALNVSNGDIGAKPLRCGWCDGLRPRSSADGSCDMLMRAGEVRWSDGGSGRRLPQVLVNTVPAAFTVEPYVTNGGHLTTLRSVF